MSDDLPPDPILAARSMVVQAGYGAAVLLTEILVRLTASGTLSPAQTRLLLRDAREGIMSIPEAGQMGFELVQLVARNFEGWMESQGSTAGGRKPD